MCIQGTSLTDPANQERLKWRALSLASIISRHFFQNEPYEGVKACQVLGDLGPIIREALLTKDVLEMPWARLILGASQCESTRRKEIQQNTTTTTTNHPDNAIDLPCNLVYAVLNAMSTFPSDNSDEIYERLSNALVRRQVFLTGAVEMSGCPPPDRGEAAFIGRSNVGKSSLINMVRPPCIRMCLCNIRNLVFLWLCVLTHPSSFLPVTSDYQSQIFGIH